ncbi:hypothetical protein I7103_005004 [Vibrio parahaemolyticus]|nr:hypothetical protein [Vibrio parahaemolyticus]
MALSLQASLVFMAQCFRFGWRRCSPLNWALYAGVLHVLDIIKYKLSNK